MTSNRDTPFSVRRAVRAVVTSANADTQIARAPWANPVNRILKLKKITVTHASGRPGRILLWDHDLSNATPAVRGSSTINLALAVLTYGTATNSGLGPQTTVYDENDLPELVFEAGAAVQSDLFGTKIAAEFEEY